MTITSLFSKSDSLSDILEGGGAGQGSGFVLDGQGYIATNAHVVTNGTGNNLTKAKQVYVQFEDGNQVEADIVGYDGNADVGVIKVDPKGLNLVPLSLGHIANVRVGDPVVAIGSPFGEQGSLSIGVVSAKNRTIEALTDFSIRDAIQTDAAINRGQLGRAAARRPRAGDRHQLADPSPPGAAASGVGFAVSVDTIAPLDRTAARRRQGPLRLHRGHVPEPLSAARRQAERAGRRRAR